MAAEYEVNIKLNSQEIETQLGQIDQKIARLGKARSGGSRKKTGIAGLLPSSEELKAAEKGIVQLTAKTKVIQSVQNKFSERRNRALIRSNALNEKELRINKQLTAEARARLRLLSQAGAKGFDGTRPQGRQAVENINALTNAQERRARLANKLNEMEAKGLNVDKLRKQLGKATTEQSARRLASANKEFRLLEKTIRLEDSKLRILKEQQKGFASSPVRGTGTMMGSPAQIAASGRQLASPIRGGINFPGSPKAIAALQKAGMDLMRLAGTAGRLAGRTARFIDSSNLRQRNAATLPSSEMLEARARKTGQDIVRHKTKEAELQERIAQALERSAQRSADVRRETQRTIPALKAARAAIPFDNIDDTFGPQLPSRTSAPLTGLIGGRGGRKFGGFGNKNVGDIALGAGFPLLFGGGPGSVIGGALGGAVGGGLAASIGLSAIGQQIDQFVGSVIQTGKAFTSTGKALDFMREKSLFSSDATKERAAVLEELGQVEELAALLTEELTVKIGNEGVRSLVDLGKTTDETTRLWGELTTQLAVLISGPLNGFLKLVNQVLGSMTARGRYEAVAKDFAGNAAFEAAVEKAKGDEPSKGARRSELGIESMKSLTKRALAGEFGEVADPVSIPVTAEDRRRFTPKGSGSGVDKAAREEARLLERLARLEQERQKILEISRFKDKIAAADALNDTQLVIRLQGEQKIAEIEASRKEDLIGVTDQREIEAINIVKATEKLAAQRDTQREINEEQRMRQELFDDTVLALEYQLKISQATSEAERERLRIEEKLQNLRKDGMKESRVAQIGQLMQQIAAENTPLTKFIKQSIESLNDLETQAVQISQGIGNAIGNSLTNGMQNLIAGAKSVKEVFADMLKSIADVLLKQAAQMIATYIAIGVARAFAGLGGASGGQGLNTGSLTQITDYSGIGANTRVSIPSFAEGGYVSSPTRAIIGEGGEPEYVIPASKMRESMTRYSRGARGSDVIPKAGASGASGEGGATAVSAPIDVRFNVERINNVDYVTAEQFQQGLQQAARQGAAEGERRTMRSLQNSTAVRRRLSV